MIVAWRDESVRKVDVRGGHDRLIMAYRKNNSVRKVGVYEEEVEMTD